MINLLSYGVPIIAILLAIVYFIGKSKGKQKEKIRQLQRTLENAQKTRETIQKTRGTSRHDMSKFLREKYTR